MNRLKTFSLVAPCLAVITLLMAFSPLQAQDFALLDKCNVVWDTPSADSRGSMPLGNGDIGLNVWVETGGDLLFYMSKTDAWSDALASNKGLVKLGRVRVKLMPNPFANGNRFQQALKLSRGEIQIAAGPEKEPMTLRVWVDANQPVIRVEAAGPRAFEMKVSVEPMRTVEEKELHADTVIAGQKNRVAWFYRNLNQRIPQLTYLTFGAMMKGEGFVSEGDLALKSGKPANAQSVAIYPRTAQTGTPEEWLALVEQQIATVDAEKWEAARAKHLAWWKEFWGRSWIFADGDEDAAKVTQGYTLQRFISACAGRGAHPLKFNGSIFVTDRTVRQKVDGVDKEVEVNADSRAWGGQYWFQNTRPMYWPMLAEGDFEMMQPLFRMFRTMLPDNAKDVKQHYGHDGAYFAETKPFWGGLSKITPEEPGSYTKHYYTPILELGAMMLDYYAFTGNEAFVRETLVPIADAGVTFYDKHFGRDAAGKLCIDPANSIEMFWKTRNPAPDIAGLRLVLTRLLALPPSLTTPEMTTRWQRLLNELPELPVGEKDGKKVLLPAHVFDRPHNSENPELYAIYPFRLYGIGKPGLELARDTFAARAQRAKGCWHQDGIQAALIGDTDTATKNVTFVLTRKDKQMRFPAFWDPGHDYAPDQDNGGNGLNTLQLMLLQAEGRRIFLLPAWPRHWNAHFKLHAPYQTVVEGIVKEGKLVDLKVTPAERKKDVEVFAADKN